MAFYNVIGNRADAFKSPSFVETLSSPIEGGDAKKYVRMFAKDPLFDMFYQHCSNSASPPLRHDAEQMNVSAKGSAHIEQHEADNLLALSRDISFARRIHQWLDAMLVAAAQSNPGLGCFERASADLSLVFAPHAAEANLSRAWHAIAARWGHRALPGCDFGDDRFERKRLILARA